MKQKQYRKPSPALLLHKCLCHTCIGLIVCTLFISLQRVLIRLSVNIFCIFNSFQNMYHEIVLCDSIYRRILLITKYKQEENILPKINRRPIEKLDRWIFFDQESATNPNTWPMNLLKLNTPQPENASILKIRVAFLYI